MTGYDRYEGMTAKQCEKKTMMYYLCRVPANRALIPAILQLENKKILDVGLGSGYYTKLLIEKNIVTGIDQNPHLCELPITVYKGDATELRSIVKGEKFDIVLATWMTDYLSPDKVRKFFGEAKAVLKNGGKLMVTFPDTYGLGFFYVKAARLLRGVEKYTHNKKQIREQLKETEFTRINIIKLNSWLFLPWAYMIIAE